MQTAPKSTRHDASLNADPKKASEKGQTGSERPGLSFFRAAFRSVRPSGVGPPLTVCGTPGPLAPVERINAVGELVPPQQFHGFAAEDADAVPRPPVHQHEPEPVQVAQGRIQPAPRQRRFVRSGRAQEKRSLPVVDEAHPVPQLLRHREERVAKAEGIQEYPAERFLVRKAGDAADDFAEHDIARRAVAPGRARLVLQRAGQNGPDPAGTVFQVRLPAGRPSAGMQKTGRRRSGRSRQQCAGD